jgi:hypothetical protein
MSCFRRGRNANRPKDRDNSPESRRRNLANEHQLAAWSCLLHALGVRIQDDHWTTEALSRRIIFRLTSKMSHAHGRHDSCSLRFLIRWFHSIRLWLAGGVTDVGVGSGALLGSSRASAVIQARRCILAKGPPLKLTDLLLGFFDLTRHRIGIAARTPNRINTGDVEVSSVRIYRI